MNSYIYVYINIIWVNIYMNEFIYIGININANLHCRVIANIRNFKIKKIFGSYHQIDFNNYGILLIIINKYKN